MVLKLMLPTIFAMSALLAPARIPQTFIAARPDEIEMGEQPINPEWIVSGQPKARAGLHSPSTDGLAATNIWDCTAGSFNWTFHDEETVYILEGSVHVTTADGVKRTLKPGDVAYFAARTTALWEIDDYVRKIAFCRTTGNPAVNALRSMLGRMKRALAA